MQLHSDRSEHPVDSSSKKYRTTFNVPYAENSLSLNNLNIQQEFQSKVNIFNTAQNNKLEDRRKSIKTAGISPRISISQTNQNSKVIPNPNEQSIPTISLSPEKRTARPDIHTLRKQDEERRRLLFQKIELRQKKCNQFMKQKERDFKQKIEDQN